MQAFNLLIENCIIFQVPKYSPYTKEQFDDWKKIWPLNFRKPPLEVASFKMSQKDFIGKIMKKTIDLASNTFLKGNRFNACVLVNGEGEEVIHETDKSERKIESLGHCVMEIMDSYSKCKVGANYINKLCFLSY